MGELYVDKDLDSFKDNFDKLSEDSQNAKLDYVEPTKNEIKQVFDIIFTFLKKNKIKIYGGFAINLLILQKNPEDAFYKENSFPDIDFYSYQPIIDIMSLCNTIYDAGFKNIRATEGQHEETYKLFVNTKQYCDISYIPKRIYTSIPTKEIDGYIICHPHFMSIDPLRMINDPLISYWRIDKGFKRFYLMQKYYPLPHTNEKLIIPKATSEEKECLEVIHNFIVNNSAIIVIGQYAMNHFLLEANKKSFEPQPVSFYEIISIEYKTDGTNLIQQLMELEKKNKKIKITITEKYPMFQFVGRSVLIYCNNNVVCILYNYFQKCYPFIEVKNIQFLENKTKKEDGNIIIGSFPLTLMYNLINMAKMKIYKEYKLLDYFYKCVSILIEIRRYYFKTHNKKIFDDTMFKDFIISCKGKTIAPEIEFQMRRNEKGFFYSYNPDDTKKEPESNYVFKNTSGNTITNERNQFFKLE
jgi:hypothetical protein